MPKIIPMYGLTNNAQAALDYYQANLGATINGVMKEKVANIKQYIPDLIESFDSDQELVMWSSINVFGSEMFIYDVTSQTINKGNADNFSIVFDASQLDEAKNVYQVLTKGIKPDMPLKSMSQASEFPYYAEFSDQFGMRWSIYVGSY